MGFFSSRFDTTDRLASVMVARTRTTLRSLGLVAELLGGPTLERFTRSWTRRARVGTLSIPFGNRVFPGDLYTVPRKEKSPALVLTHGVIESGKDDPRLVRFAATLARYGFVVLVPELREMKSLRLRMEESQDIVAAYLFLMSLDIVDRQRAGLLGFSYGAGPTLTAAANPAIACEVKFVACIGGYFDPVNVVRYVTTGYDRYGDYTHTQPPDAYGKEVLVKNLLEHVEDDDDRAVLHREFAERPPGAWSDAPTEGSRQTDLSPAGAALKSLLLNRDPDRVVELVARCSEGVRRYLESLALRPHLARVRARLIIGHGDTDPLIPATESLRLAHAMKDQNEMHLAILQLLGHVDPKSPGKLRARLSALICFYDFVQDIMKQQIKA